MWRLAALVASLVSAGASQYDADPDAAPAPGGCAGAYPGLCGVDDRAGGIDRFGPGELTREAFIRDYAARDVPVLVEGVPRSLGWPLEGTGLADLGREYGDVPFVFEHRWFPGEEGHIGRLANDTLAAYVAKAAEIGRAGSDNQRAASGVIDSGLLGPEGVLDDAYWAPPFFADSDLFVVVSSYLESIGAPQSLIPRYIVMGPRGAGTTLHTDPIETSAWNVAVSGSKIWTTFPRDLVPRWVAPKEYEAWREMSNFDWYRDVFPALGGRGIPYQSFVQRAGDAVWVPGGFAHQTINRQESLSVTSNMVFAHDAAAVLGAVCEHPFDLFGEDDDSVFDVERAIYFCVAFARLFSDVHARSCCAGADFGALIDEFEPVAALSALDYVSNSDYLARMTRAAARVPLEAGVAAAADAARAAAADDVAWLLLQKKDAGGTKLEQRAPEAVAPAHLRKFSVGALDRGADL